MGNILVKIAPNSTLSTDVYPPTSKFDPERDMPDLSGKIVLVTGGNTGIGYHTVRFLLLKNAKTETGKRAIFLELDLADLHSVRRAATAFLAQETRCDVLFNNGGVMLCPTDQLTPQGHDIQFGTDVIGHYFLTELLLPALTASYEATQVAARIINTSSTGHTIAAPGTGIDFVRLYGESKLGNVLIANHWAKKHSDVLVSCALHPGSVRTGLQKHMSGWFQRILDFVIPGPECVYPPNQ
ncbi:hypothetical protein C8R43DRAFT_1137945 [Mycena crocata]|nr:hypothetical protein C8R43DRAFT_1137945 [Mycena crocata]